ncbi:MAG: hypothetical protein V7L04_28155 [Nostoc sp.]|uniref:hypothetical protein n=1 Tax=Nostoc sp. TaxID=1180 RepID=UPI002FFBB130
MAQTPTGALVDASRHKRSMIAIATLAVAISYMVIVNFSALPAVVAAQAFIVLLYETHSRLRPSGTSVMRSLVLRRSMGFVPYIVWRIFIQNWYKHTTRLNRQSAL